MENSNINLDLNLKKSDLNKKIRFFDFFQRNRDFCQPWKVVCLNPTLAATPVTLGKSFTYSCL